MSNENLNTLKLMFEQIDEGVLQFILEEARGDLNAAIELAIEMTSGHSPAPAPASAPVTAPVKQQPQSTRPKNEKTQEEEDAALARALQAQLTNEDNTDFAYAQQLQRQMDEEVLQSNRAHQQANRPLITRSFGVIEEDDDDGDEIDMDFIAKFLEQTMANEGKIAEPYGSQFKGMVQNIVNSQMQQLELPEIQEDNDSVAYTVGEISLEDVHITQENIDIKPYTITENDTKESNEKSLIKGFPAFELSISGFNARIAKFPWSFNKKTFPKLKDNGKAKAKATGILIQVILQLVPSPKTFATIRVSKTVVNIKKIDVKISDTKASVIYNMLLSAFSGRIKREIENKISSSISQALVNG